MQVTTKFQYLRSTYVKTYRDSGIITAQPLPSSTMGGPCKIMPEENFEYQKFCQNKK